MVIDRQNVPVQLPDGSNRIFWFDKGKARNWQAADGSRLWMTAAGARAEARKWVLETPQAGTDPQWQFLSRTDAKQWLREARFLSKLILDADLRAALGQRKPPAARRASIPCTIGEHEAWKQAAADRGLSLAEFVRRTMNSMADYEP
ncbi:MAG: hypothetical protein OXF86_11920 [Caldilineaceae bacterium]|nr:hypothetical protein [Caldilineaceae bacterium]